MHRVELKKHMGFSRFFNLSNIFGLNNIGELTKRSDNFIYENKRFNGQTEDIVRLGQKNNC